MKKHTHLKTMLFFLLPALGAMPGALAGQVTGGGEAGTPVPAPAEAEAPPKDLPNAYDQMGGAGAVAVLAETWWAGVKKDETLSAHEGIAKAIAANAGPALRFQLANFFCALGGGMEKYNGPEPAHIYAGLGMTDKEWGAAKAVFKKALEDVKASPEATAAWNARLAVFEQSLKNALDVMPVAYHSKDLGLALNVPRSWDVKESKKEGVLVALSPFAKQGDPYRENVTVTVDTLPVPMDATEFLKAYFVLIHKRAEGLKVEAFAPVAMDGKEGVQTSYRYDLGKNGLVSKVRSFVHEGKGYIVSHTALEKDAAEFAPLFEAVVRSVTLKP